MGLWPFGASRYSLFGMRGGKRSLNSIIMTIGLTPQSQNKINDSNVAATVKNLMLGDCCFNIIEVIAVTDTHQQLPSLCGPFFSSMTASYFTFHF